jgi:hypothetical protein
MLQDIGVGSNRQDGSILVAELVAEMRGARDGS